MKPEVAYGLVLRRMRRERDITQEQLAHDSGLVRAHISNLERGQIMPSLGTMLRIAEALDINPVEMFSQIITKIHED